MKWMNHTVLSQGLYMEVGLILGELNKWTLYFNGL